GNGVRRRALSLVNGSFSERFAHLVRACGKECVRLDVPLGCAVEPDMLRDALRRTPVDAVTLVHSETSTGVLQDVAALAAVVREVEDVLLLVDAVTSVAGSPVATDAWGLDVVLTGSQKALALPPGLARGVASPRMLERADSLPDRGPSFALVGFTEASDTRWTICSGDGPLKASTVRIGHMGDRTVGPVEELLALLQGLLA